MAVDINKLSQRYEALRQERAPWDAAWRDLAEHFLPTRFQSDTDANPRKPGMLNKKLVDTTGILDMRTLAAGMQGGMTSPVRPWFRITLEDEDAARGTQAGAWLDEVTSRMQALLHRSNFYNAAHSLYSDLGTFGPGLLLETADWQGLRFRLIPAGSYVLDVDHQGQVDTFMYSLGMSARQLLQCFGESAVPDVVRTAARQPGQGLRRAFTVVHAVFPRSERVFGKLDGANMPFASVHWLMCGGTGSSGGYGGKPHVLRESGFRQFPAFAPRWDVTGNDTYGRSPAMDVLADVRMLQQMGLTTLKAMHKAVDPPLSVPDGLRSVGVDLTPGGVNYLSPSGPDKAAITPIQQVAPQIVSAAQSYMQEVRQKVHDGLFADLFKMLMQNDRRQITATEVEAREREKMVILGPVVERLDKEFLSPLILRTFALMEEYDHLPPVPQGLAQASLRVEFESALAQAQRLATTSPIDETVAFASGVAQLWPEVRDIIDADCMVRQYADNLGAPAAMLLPEGDVERIRKARAEAQQEAQQQAQQQEAMKQAVDLSGAARNLGQTPVGADGQTAMQALMGGLGSV